jgi:CRISPR-associated protein Csa1
MLSWRVVRIDDSLRRAFLDARDRVAMILEHLEEPPQPLDQCPQACPYFEVCRR